ncbi:MAG: universal stress protein [Breznakibacter sp.]
MKRIMLLTDFSDTARNATTYALKMYEKEKVEFVLINAFDLEFSGSPYIVQVKEELDDESQKSLKKELDVIHRRFPHANVESLSLFGTLIDVVQKELGKNQYNLVVMGCRGETALENFPFGQSCLRGHQERKCANPLGPTPY